MRELAASLPTPLRSRPPAGEGAVTRSALAPLLSSRLQEQASKIEPLVRELAKQHELVDWKSVVSALLSY
jgi:hypothetical protein